MRMEGVSRMDQRLDMVLAPERYGLTVREVAGLWGVSRETFYYWRGRYEAEGEAGLANRSTAPHRSPGRLAWAIESQIVELRTGHRRWGARRIRAELRRRGIIAPSVSTIHRVLVRHRLVRPAPKPPPATQRFEREAPNELWQLDGLEYPLTDGTTAHIVSVLDDHSRFCGHSKAFESFDAEAAIAVFNAATRALGLPYSTLTDRGSQLTGRRTSTVSRFERHLWPLGVVTINGRGYHPQTQGKIERWHRTLREWLDDNGPYQTLDQLNAELGRFRSDYNHDRPHQGIGDLTPAQRWAATPPRGPDPAGTIDRRQREALRTTWSNGNVRWGEWIIVLGRPWANTKVRIIDTGDRITVLDGDQPIRIVTPDPARHVIASGRPHSKPRL
jgi:transposase InsO family protein